MFKILLLMLAVATVIAAQSAGGPLYQPGDVRAGKDLAEPLDPPAQSGKTWLVAPSIELHHFEEGTGTPILIVHGGPGFAPAQAWRAGALLSNKYRFIYYHQRGCGLSTHPIQSFPDPNMGANVRTVYRTLGLGAQVADIERIRRILKIDRLILLGQSFGADIAILYATEFPEHVRALILAAPANMAVFPKTEGNLYELVRQRLPEAMQKEFGMYLAEYFNFPRAFRRTDAESSEFNLRFGKYYGMATGGPAPVSSNATQAGFVPLACFLSMGMKHDYSEAYRRVQAPVLVLHGANDLQPESVTKALASYFPNSRYVRIEGAAHFIYDERPQEFAAEVRRFLEGLPPVR